MTDLRSSPSHSKHAESRQQVFLSFGMMCLGFLVFYTMVSNAMSRVEPQPTSTDSTVVPKIFPTSSAPGLSDGQMQTILSSIEELSALINKSMASLRQDLDRANCKTVTQSEQETNTRLGAISIVATFGFFLWGIGLVVLSEALGAISTTLRNRVWGLGLMGANIGLGYASISPAPRDWLSYISWTVGSLHVGQLVGLVSDRTTFLAEEKPQRKD